jgi:hypothetical protein
MSTCSFFGGVPSHASGPPILLALNASFDRTCLPRWDWPTGQDSFQTFVPVDTKGQVGPEVKLILSTWEESYSTLGRIMFHRVRTAAGVLVENFWKIHLQGLPSFLYASKRCSSMSSHGIFFLVLERFCSSLLEQLSSSLLGSGSLCLNHCRYCCLLAHSLAV